MSALSCGCDPEVRWLCTVHLEELRDSDIASPFPFAPFVGAETVIASAPPMSALEESLIDTQRHVDMLMDQMANMFKRIEAERAAIARTLADFYRAPLSMSSVQPILTLAETLNPELRERG